MGSGSAGAVRVVVRWAQKRGGALPLRAQTKEDGGVWNIGASWTRLIKCLEIMTGVCRFERSYQVLRVKFLVLLGCEQTDRAG